jgi:hypothetical protein
MSSSSRLSSKCRPQPATADVVSGGVPAGGLQEPQGKPANRGGICNPRTMRSMTSNATTLRPWMITETSDWL